jgi:hypothetical protein
LVAAFLLLKAGDGQHQLVSNVTAADGVFGELTPRGRGGRTRHDELKPGTEIRR